MPNIEDTGREVNGKITKISYDLYMGEQQITISWILTVWLT